MGGKCAKNCNKPVEHHSSIQLGPDYFHVLRLCLLFFSDVFQINVPVFYVCNGIGPAFVCISEDFGISSTFLFCKPRSTVMTVYYSYYSLMCGLSLVLTLDLCGSNVAEEFYNFISL